MIQHSCFNFCLKIGYVAKLGFKEKTQLRLAAAIEMYKKGEVTLSRAAEVAEMGFFQFKEIMKDREVRMEAPRVTKEELERGVELIRKLRKKKVN